MSESMAAEPANTPEPPYYAVIFTSISHESKAGYAETAQRMLRLVAHLQRA